MATPEALTPPSRFRLTPARVLAALALYLALMALQASLLAPSGRSDDIETLLLSQSLAWGYEAKNPPAFYWLAWAATHAAGPGLPVIYALRLAGVFATFAGLYAIARRLQPDPLLAACAGLAMLATLHFHWYLLFYLTNTTFAMALAPLAVLALFRLRDRPTLASYALLGAVVGLGILSRYNCAIFAAALVAAALAAPEWRARLLRRRALLSPRHRPSHAPAARGLDRAELGHPLRPRSPARSSAPRRRPTPAASPTAFAPRRSPRSASSSSRSGSWPPSASPAPSAPSPSPTPSAPPASPSSAASSFSASALMLLYVAAGSSYVKPHHLFFLAFAPLWLIARLDAAALAPWRARGLRGSASPPAPPSPPSPTPSTTSTTPGAATPARSSSRSTPTPPPSAPPASSAAPSSPSPAARTSPPPRCAAPSPRPASSPPTTRVYAPPPNAAARRLPPRLERRQRMAPPLARRPRRARPPPRPPPPRRRPPRRHPRQGPPLRPRRPRPPLRPVPGGLGDCR